jgi:hypothetical protein
MASAVAVDVRSGEHPVHTALLILTATVVLALCGWRRGGTVPALPAACTAIIAGPLLHLVSPTPSAASLPHDHADPLHIVSSEFPTVVVQIAIPAVVLLSVTAVAHLVHLLVGRVCRPLTSRPAPPPTIQPAVTPVRSRRLGSMLRWCGWAIRAARRGPPLLTSTAAHQAVTPSRQAVIAVPFGRLSAAGF